MVKGDMLCIGNVGDSRAENHRRGDRRLSRLTSDSMPSRHFTGALALGAVAAAFLPVTAAESATTGALAITGAGVPWLALGSMLTATGMSAATWFSAWNRCPRGSSGFDIFLSYRRIDHQIARSVKLALEKLGYSVFMDIASEGLSGGDFQQQLRHHLACTPVVLCLCTASANPNHPDTCEFERIKDDGDFVRLEVAEALRLEKLLIPIYTSQAPGTPAFDIGTMVLRADLPSDVADLANQSFVELSTNFFDASIDKVHAFIQTEAATGRLQSR